MNKANKVSPMQIEDFITSHEPFPSATADLKDPTLHPARRRWVTELARAVKFYGLKESDAVILLNTELAKNKLGYLQEEELYNMFLTQCKNLMYPTNFPAKLYSFAYKFESECGRIRTHKWCPPVYAKLWLCCIILGRNSFNFGLARSAFSQASKGMGNLGVGSIQQFVNGAKHFEFLDESQKGIKGGSPTKFFLHDDYDCCIFKYYFYIARQQTVGYERTFCQEFINAFPELGETIAKELKEYVMDKEQMKRIGEYLNSNIS